MTPKRRDASRSRSAGRARGCSREILSSGGVLGGRGPMKWGLAMTSFMRTASEKVKRPGKCFPRRWLTSRSRAADQYIPPHSTDLGENVGRLDDDQDVIANPIGYAAVLTVDHR